MARRQISLEEIKAVHDDLWEVVRALTLIEQTAIRVSNNDALPLATVGALMEGMAGTANIASAFVRRQQIALGGDE